MAWFTDEFETFLSELKGNNNREWFLANKKRYDRFVKQPFEAFVAELILRMQHYDPECRIQPKDAIFRINRDIRFSIDKTPYKTMMSAVIGSGGRKSTTMTGMYIELGHQHLRLYGGVYMPDKDELFKIRQEISYCLDEFNQCLNDPLFKKHFETIRGEQNKRIPPEFKDVVEVQPLVANKQFYYYADLKPTLLQKESLIDELYQVFECSLPMKNFLLRALKD